MEYELLRSDWAGDRKSMIAEIRWRRAKKWRSKGLEYGRGQAMELRVSGAAHARLVDIWHSVRSIDAGVPQLARSALGDSQEWKKGTSASLIAQVMEQCRAAGVAEDGPVWIAAHRAAARAAQRWRVRVVTYGWGRSILDRDVVTTIRLPFGEFYGAPPIRIAETRWLDRTLLGEFEAAGADSCAYAECALLSPGWAIRFISVRPTAERRAAKDSANEMSSPPY